MSAAKKLPSMQFYPGDWRKDLAVQSLTYEERGVWHEILMFMWESEERGYLTLNGQPISDSSLACMLGLGEAKVKQMVKQIVSKNVARIDPRGALYNRRMVTDEQIRSERIKAGHIGGLASASKRQAKGQANPTPSSSSSSSSSSSKQTTTPLPPSKGVRADSQPSGKNGDYRITTDLQSVICAWKVVLGVPPDDRDWDKLNWRKHCAPAKKLLDFFDGDWKRAASCAEDVFAELKSKNLDCALTTVCNRAYEWRQKNANDK